MAEEQETSVSDQGALEEVVVEGVNSYSDGLFTVHAPTKLGRMI